MTDFAKLVLDADTTGLKSGERDLEKMASTWRTVKHLPQRMKTEELWWSHLRTLWAQLLNSWACL